jgi:Tetracyclin repressor-like, C-terminal domain
LSEQKHKEVRRERRRYHETFRGMVVEGQQARVFRDDISADLCVEYFFGSVHHLPTWWKPGGRLSAQEVGRSFADVFIAGLTPP